MAPPTTYSPKRRKRVLLIDEDPATAEWTREILEAEGYEARCALIGTRGQELFRQWGPDAVRGEPVAAGCGWGRTGPAPEGNRPVAGDHRPRRTGRRITLGGGDAGGRVLLPGEAGHARRAGGRAAERVRAHARARRAPAAEGAGARAVQLCQRGGAEQGDEGPVRADRERGGQRGEHPDPGRERHRQGAHRQRDPPPLGARARPVHQDQLRRHPARSDRKRAVRLPQGRLHRRHRGQGGPVRDGGRRVAAARRGGRDAVGAADQAAARAAAARVPADRQRPHGARGLPPDLQHQRRSGAGAA